MVIIILIICIALISLLTYCTFTKFKDNNWDIIGCVKTDTKGFFLLLIGVMISFIIAYFCFVIPTDFIHIEYSPTGDSVIKNDVKKPVTTYGKVIKVEHGTHMINKLITSYTSVTVKLNDNREMNIELDKYENIKEGNSMSVTETFYPSYKVDYNF